MSQADKITPEVAEKILAKDYANIVRKVTEGKPLTKAERDMIQSKASGSMDESITIAKDVTELSSILGVSRQTLYQWKKMEDAPKANPNGSHSVVAWRQFVKTKGLNAGTKVENKFEALKARKLLAEIEERELKTAILKEEYVSLDLVRTVWTTNVGKAIALMRAKFENELPPILSGMDAISIQSECQAAIDEVCRAIHEGEF
ncbi:MAG: hypothetical protein JW739_08180 [Opitutales bacterium]|nr:hypothetical protein [Opitutales bacterium]